MAKPSESVLKEMVSHFCSVTGSTEEIAHGMLEACEYNLEMAVGMQMDNPAESALGHSQQESNNPAANPASQFDDDEHVRAPIAPRREVLVGPNEIPPWAVLRRDRRRPVTAFDAFRDFEAEGRRQEEELNSHGTDCSAGEKSSTQKEKLHYSRLQTLEDLFRPPLDIMHKGSFETARDEGVACGKWLLANIQDTAEFACQVLNRDVWSNQKVKEIVKEHFIFWQVMQNSHEGERYKQFYHFTEFPYIAIIDPRTGENVVTWSKMDASTFVDVIKDFLSEHPSFGKAATTEQSEPPQKKAKHNEATLPSLFEMTEESQMAAAIKASLKCDSESSSTDELETFDSDSNSGTPPKSPKNSMPANSLAVTNSKTIHDLKQGVPNSAQLPNKCLKTNCVVENGGACGVGCKRKRGCVESVSKGIENMEVKDQAVAPASVTLTTFAKAKEEKLRKLRLGTDDLEEAEGQPPIEGGINHSLRGPCNETHPEEDKRDCGTYDTEDFERRNTEKCQPIGRDHSENGTIIVGPEPINPNLDSMSKEDCKIIVRLTDGQRLLVTLPASAPLRDLFNCCSEAESWSSAHEILMLHPRVLLTDLDADSTTLRAAGLYPQQTVYVQIEDG